MRKVFIILTLLASVIILVPQSHAGDTGIEGFNAISFRPNTDGKGIFNVDTANVLYPGEMNIGSHFSYARKTVSFSDPALGGLVTDLAENQVLMNLNVGIGLLEFLDVGMDIPIVLMQNGTRCLNATCSNLNNYTGSSLGDIRFAIKLRILEDKKGSVGLALISDVGIPTGKRKLFTGGKNASYEQRVAVSKKFKHAEVAANIGYRIVDSVEALNIKYDDSLTFGVAAKAFFPKDFFAYGTITGNAYLADSSKASTPVELMAGVGHKWKNGLKCSLGGGVKLVDGITAADYRAMGHCGIEFGLTKKAKERLNPNPIQEWVISMKTNQWRLKKSQKELLEDVIRWLNEDHFRRIVIIGSADDRALYDYNMNLSTKRAIAARNYLFKRSVLPEQVSIRTYGEVLPVAYGKTNYDRSLNRSIVIRELRN